jgi:hypothetical protein
VPAAQRLRELWFARCIQPRYERPEVVPRVLRKQVSQVIGSVAPPDVPPSHINHLLERIVAAEAATVANDAQRCT